MNVWLAFAILGVLQGLTEFLPVSSSGHLVVVQNLTGFAPPRVLTDIVLHLATLAAVFIYYLRDSVSILSVRPTRSVRRPGLYLWYLVLATVVTLAVIYPFRHWLEEVAGGRSGLPVVGWAFLATALLLVLTDRLLLVKRLRAPEVTSLSWMPVVFVGLVQGIAAIPGLSRAGSTIFAGFLGGLNREEAARFSFLLFIPAALVAAVYAGMQLAGEPLPARHIGPLILGFFTALISGLFAIRTLLAILKRARLSYFAAYLVLASLVSFVTYFFG